MAWKTRIAIDLPGGAKVPRAGAGAGLRTLLCVVLSGTSMACPQPAPERSGVVRVGLLEGPRTLDPVAAEGPGEEMLSRLLMLPLARRGPDEVLEPLLARAWSCDDAGCRIWPATCRFSDGTPLTPELLRDSLERAHGPGPGWSISGGAVAVPVALPELEAFLLDPRSAPVPLPFIERHGAAWSLRRDVPTTGGLVPTGTRSAPWARMSGRGVGCLPDPVQRAGLEFEVGEAERLSELVGQGSLDWTGPWALHGPPHGVRPELLRPGTGDRVWGLVGPGAVQVASRVDRPGLERRLGSGWVALPGPTEVADGALPSAIGWEGSEGRLLAEVVAAGLGLTAEREAPLQVRPGTGLPLVQVAGWQALQPPFSELGARGEGLAWLPFEFGVELLGD